MVFKEKRGIKDNRQYNVYIHNDQTKEERVQATNVKKMLGGIKHGDVSRLQTHGSYIVSKSEGR